MVCPSSYRLAYVTNILFSRHSVLDKLAEQLLLSIHVTFLLQRHSLCTSHTRLSGVVVARGKSRLGRLDAVGLALLAFVVIFGASQIHPSSFPCS